MGDILLSRTGRGGTNLEKKLCEYLGTRPVKGLDLHSDEVEEYIVT